jgi:hypothetical protein
MGLKHVQSVERVLDIINDRCREPEMDRRDTALKRLIKWLTS